TEYPKAGDPNPTVKVGIVEVSGGPVRWAEQGDYPEDATLIVRVGWSPDSRQVFYYVQDRAQTWLDFCAVGRAGGAPLVLFRATTGAWVEDPGPPHFLKDGSFLFFSERSGWKHLYHLTGNGKLKRAVTHGEWEVHDLYGVDEENGWVYFSGTRDSPLGKDLYRVKLDGSGLTRLTSGRGHHCLPVAPQCKLFVATWSDHLTPPRVRLYRADGSLARTLDTNPVYAVEDYEFAEWEFAQIKTLDGFLLEGMILTPPKLDPKRKYPVWFKTYGGAHMPTAVVTWSGGLFGDQALVRGGALLLACDPRTARGQGARFAR